MLPETTSAAPSDARLLAGPEGHEPCAALPGPFRSELTPEGEQLVIPGCERNRSARMRQLDLFG